MPQNFAGEKEINYLFKVSYFPSCPNVLRKHHLCNPVTAEKSASKSIEMTKNIEMTKRIGQNYYDVERRFRFK